MTNMTHPSTETVLTSDSFDDDPAIESLSPAALAVLNAFLGRLLYVTGDEWLDDSTKEDCHSVAAALRAAADQVVPLENTKAKMFAWQQERLAQRLKTRDRLLAIATELETQ